MVERVPDKNEVNGSIPLSPTIIKSFLVGRIVSGKLPLFSVSVPELKGQSALLAEAKTELTGHLVEEGAQLPDISDVHIEIGKSTRFLGVPISFKRLKSERI